MAKTLAEIIRNIIAAGTLLSAAAAGQCADSAYYNLSSSRDKAEMRLSGGITIAASSSTANTATIRLDGAAGSVSANGTINSAAGFTRNGTDILAGTVPLSRKINVAAPLAGGGELSGDITLHLPAADEMTDGYITAEDWSAFNSKLSYNGSGTGLTGIVKLADANITGQLTTASTMTVRGNAFSVGVSTLVVSEGRVGIGTASPQAALDMGSGGIRLGGETRTSWPSLASTGVVPSGAVITYVLSTCPEGYLPLNGSAVSRMTYAALFSMMGTTYGTGDGSSTFNVPDTRGYFIRGYDSGAGVDASRVFGSRQEDTLQGHNHPLVLDLGEISNGSRGSGSSAQLALGDGNAYGTMARSSTHYEDGAHGVPRVSTETRPKNIAFQYCVKY